MLQVCTRIDQVYLVNTDDRFDVEAFGADQKAIDELRLEVRVCGSAHNQHLVNISDQNMFAALAPA